MPLTFEIAPSIRAEAKKSFEDDARLIWAVYQRLWEENLIPESDVRLVLSVDFTVDVRRLTAPGAADAPAFSPERIGGLVSAKNLPQAPDYSNVAIVFDGRNWTAAESDGSGLARFQQLSLMAHELAHPPLERVLHACGAIQQHSQTTAGTEMLREAARVIANEYRADRVADILVRQLAKKADGSPAGTWDAFGARDLASLIDVLQGAYPAWPDTVHAYRIRQLNLNQLLEKLLPSVGGTLMVLAHVQASADGADEPTVLGREDLSKLPAVQLYIAEPWEVFVKELRAHRMLPMLKTALEDDIAVTGAGETLWRQLLRKLGLTIDDLNQGDYYVHVTDPAR